MQHTLMEEQNKLYRERDRQTRAAATVTNEEYKDVQVRNSSYFFITASRPFISSRKEPESDDFLSRGGGGNHHVCW